MIHLDTSFLIRALLPGSPEDTALRGWLRRGLPIGASALAWAELLCGPLKRSQADLALLVVGELVPFGREDAALAASLFNAAGRRRGSLVDCMIAAAAIRSRAALATGNEADFARFVPHGLRLATT
ncbi:MAG TPA: PIN domain-containing protein [Thermoanaerobaculia bacterium]|nr:PIN domain-containing protein [Thermoanaerobaculia bacterium]